MEEKELLLKEIKGLIADATKGVITEKALNEKVDAINAQLKVLNDREDNHKEVKELKESVEKLLKATTDNAAAIAAFTEGAKKANEKPMSFKDAIMKGFENSAKDIPSLITKRTENGKEKMSINDYFNKLGNKQSPEIKIDFGIDELVNKVAVDMSQANIVNSNVNTVRMTSLDPNMVGTPLTLFPHVVDWMPVKPIDNKFMSILVTYSYEDGSGTKTQGSTASKSSFVLKTVEFVSAVIGTKFRLTSETLEDLPEAMDEIARVAPSKIKDNIDYQILGSAGDDTSTIKGLYAASKHTDFASATTYATTIPSANRIDAISMMKDQAETSKYIATDVILNPLDVRKIAAEKDQLDNSRIDRRVAFNALGEPIAIDGLMIRKNTNQTANTVTVLAKEMVQIGDRRNMTLEVGYDGNDFTEGWKTVIISVRLAFGVRDALAVIYCDDLDAAVAAITV